MSDTAFTDSTDPKVLPFSAIAPNFRQIDINDIAEFFLGMIGDPDDAGIASTRTHSCSLV